MKLKRSLVLLLSVNLVFSSIQLPVFANETNELKTEESVSVNSDLEEVDIDEDLAEDVDVISDEEIAEEEMTEENVMETEGTVTIGSGVGKVSSNTSSTTNKYSAAWQYWSQGASKYKGMRSGGCRVTAFAKLLYEAGYTNVGNPDNFLVWGINNGFFQSTSNVTELGTFGNAIIRYVSNNGGKCTLIANNTLTGNTSTDKANIMNYIRQGYYVVLSCSAHTAYIGRDISISCGQPVILDSWSSWSTNPATVHTYTGTYDSMSKVTFTRYRVYSIVPQTVTKDTTPPTIKDIEITDVDNTGYTVFCTVTDNVGIGKVQFPTWTDKNGQDDIAWKEGFQVGSNTSQGVTFRVNVSEHNNEEGTYNTHIYAWDTSGNKTCYPIQTYVDRTPPTITNVRVSNLDSTGYTVTCNVTDNLYVNRVQFPTWTELNGQDDIISEWWNNSSASGTRNGTTFTYRVNRSAHNMELYNYHSHIYAYDDYGNYSMVGIDVDCVLGEKVDLGQFFNARIKNAGTGTYLTYGASNVYGEKMKKFSQDQEWFLIRLKDGSYCIWALWHGDLYRNQEDRMEVNIDETDAIVSLKGGKVLDVAGAVNANGTNVQVYDSNNTLAQKWNIYKAPKGYYLIPQCSVDQALDLDAASQNLQTHLCWNGTPQFFYIEQYEDDQENFETNNQNDRDIPTTNQPNTSPADNSNVEQKQDISTTDLVDVNKKEADTNKDQMTDFVSRMYTVALNRNAEENGLKDWTNKLQTGEIDGAGIAWGFIGSQEFANRKLSNSDYLDVLYRTFFDREADTEGKSNWLSKMNAGTSREEVLNGFVNSQEFDNLCDSFGIDNKAVQANTNSTGTGVRGYVLRMYTKALNREGEQAGVEDWTNRINTRAMSPEAVAKSFFFSQEFANRHLSNEDYVETLYQTFMDRASDAGGKQYWMNKLNSGMSRQQVLEGFSRSEEFSKIMKRYGL